MEHNFKNIQQAVNLLKTIANENRLRILCRLNGAEISVNDLAQFIKISQSALSQHLSIMREHGFVKTRRDQQTIYYSLASQEIQEIITILYKHYCY